MSAIFFFTTTLLVSISLITVSDLVVTHTPRSFYDDDDDVSFETYFVPADEENRNTKHLIAKLLLCTIELLECNNNKTLLQKKKKKLLFFKHFYECETTYNCHAFHTKSCFPNQFPFFTSFLLIKRMKSESQCSTSHLYCII